MSILEQICTQVKATNADAQGWHTALCPVHEGSGNGHRPSLRIRAANEVADGALVVCMAGCSAASLHAALGLDAEVRVKPNENSGTALFYRPPVEDEAACTTAATWTPHGPAIATYEYRDEAGRLLYVVCRTADKQFPCYVPDPSAPHGKRWRLSDVRRVLYRLPQVIEAAKTGTMIFVAEGEKDVLALERLGLVATTAAGGAGRGKWKADYAAALKGTEVIVLPDNDEPGREHAREVLQALRKEGIRSAIVDIAAGMEPGADVSDAIAAGLNAEILQAMAADALANQPSPLQPPADDAVTVMPLPIHTVAELRAMHIPQPEYVVAPPFSLARGTVAELDAYPKHGKTRFCLDAVWSVLHCQPFLGGATVPAKVLYLTEEWLTTWQKALSEADLLEELGDGLQWMSLLDLRDRQDGDWSQICKRVGVYCAEQKIGLLIVDTLARWAQVVEEKDAHEMAAAVLPLRLIAAQNLAVLFLRHDRKGGGELGESGRGSSATSGEADFIMHLQRKRGSGQATLRQRELEGIGRLTGMTGKLVVELGEGGHFELLGAQADVALERAKQYALNVLPIEEAEARRVEELAHGFEGSRATLERALRELCRQAVISARQGAGHAATSRGRRAIGYWRSEPCQDGFDFASEKDPSHSFITYRQGSDE